MAGGDGPEAVDLEHDKAQVEAGDVREFHRAAQPPVEDLS
jgi:hypothetical protein